MRSESIATAAESAVGGRIARACRLIDEFEGELDLARGAGGFADDAEAAAEDGIGGKAKVDDVEDVEKFGAKFEIRQFAVSAMAKWRVLDESNIVLMKAWTAKGVASQGAEVAGIWTGASGEIDWNVEEGAIVSAAAKIVFANGAAGGKIGHRNEIGAIRSARTRAGLLDAGVDGERRAAGQRCDVEKLPATSHVSA